MEYSALIRDRAETIADVLRDVELNSVDKNSAPYTTLKNSFKSDRDLFYGMVRNTSQVPSLYHDKDAQWDTNYI